MENKILFIGLDVDDKNFNAYALIEGEKEGIHFKCRPTVKALLEALKSKLEGNFTYHFCYESTYCGYHICRTLRKAGHEYTIIASSLIPEKAGDKIKKDRLDSEKLAIYFSKGLLTPIHIPSEEDEFVRTMVRSRTFLKEQHKELRKHTISICKQMGWHYKEESKAVSYWTQQHQTWLNEKLKAAPEYVRFNFKIIEAQINDIEERLNQYEVEFRKIAELSHYKEKVQSLVCYRGIDILSAMVIVTEIGDIRRFSHPKNLSSFAGLDIREYSSGGVDRKYSITKMGNKRLRWILTEIAQNYNRVPIIGKALRARRQDINPKYTEIADRCMHRIHKRGKHLWHKGKPVNKVKTACAREILGFIWESLNMATL